MKRWDLPSELLGNALGNALVPQLALLGNASELQWVLQSELQWGLPLVPQLALLLG